MQTAQPMSKEELYQRIVNLLHDMFELDKSLITPSANLYTDLDIDSIDAVDIAVQLQQLTGRRLQQESFKKVRTVQDVVDALSDLSVAEAN